MCIHQARPSSSQPPRRLPRSKRSSGGTWATPTRKQACLGEITLDAKWVFGIDGGVTVSGWGVLMA
jgi:hypothetical protein